MTITAVLFLELADSIAKQALELATKLGTGIEADTASLGAQNNIDRVAGLGVGFESEMGDLLESFSFQLQAVTTMPVSYDRYGVPMKALNQHLGGIDTFLTAQAVRVAPEFKTAIEMLAIARLSGANTFPPVHDPMDTCEITGANTAIWVDILDINVNDFYATNLIMEKTSVAAGADAITINLTCMKFDGTTEAKAVAVDASDAIGTKYDIGIHPADKYIGVTLDSIVCIIGSTGETWKVLSELERAVAL